MVEQTIENSYTVCRLHPSNSYLVEVSAHTSVGSGKRAETIVTTTELSLLKLFNSFYILLASVFSLSYNLKFFEVLHMHVFNVLSGLK